MTLVPTGGRGLDRLKLKDARHPSVGGMMNRSPPRVLPATGCAAIARVSASSGRRRAGLVAGVVVACACGAAWPKSRARTTNGFCA